MHHHTPFKKAAKLECTTMAGVEQQKFTLFRYAIFAKTESSGLRPDNDSIFILFPLFSE
jgi:hypothetical protein